MKVAFIARSTLYTSPGGDTRQADLTARHLRKIGVHVDVLLTNQSIDYGQYDLLHFFNIIRPADILRHTSRTKVPYVLSTIFVEYGHEADEGGLRGRLHKTIGTDGVEYIKAVARRLKNGERIRSVAYIMRGHRRAVIKAALGAAILLPNSESEYRRLVQRYGVRRPYHVVPNGVDTERILAKYEKLPDYNGAVICMGRIEPRKNQLRLIQALRGSGYKLIICGAASPNHAAYEQRCREAAGDDCTFAGWLNSSELFAAYASAKVHVLPSFFETTGLSSLEAAAMGCNIVITDRGDTRDYFGENAWYCNPEDIHSVRAAVDAAYAAPYDESFRTYILEHYTWERAAQETFAAYKQIIR